MEAYKLSKDYRDQKIAFSILTYLEGKDEAWKKVITHFSDLDISFLDEDSEVEEEPTPEAKGDTNTLAPTS